MSIGGFGLRLQPTLLIDKAGLRDDIARHQPLSRAAAKRTTGVSEWWTTFKVKRSCVGSERGNVGGNFQRADSGLNVVRSAGWLKACVLSATLEVGVDGVADD